MNIVKPISVDKDIGIKVKTLREARNFSKMDIQKMLKGSIEPSIIRRMEETNHPCSEEAWKRYLSALGLDFDDFSKTEWYRVTYPNLPNLSKNMQRIRIENKMSRAALAKALHVDVHRISFYESNCGRYGRKYRIHVKLIIKFMSFFKVGIDELTKDIKN